MAGRKIIRQRQSRTLTVADNDILIFKPDNFIQFWMHRIIRRTKPQRQINLPASNSVNAGLCGK
jgi:hypothetical protein